MQPKVSLCMIVKNEEAHLSACLDSVEDLVDEMVIVDTGSTDRTKDIVTRYRGRLYDFPWIDDFAAARNECLKHAAGQWIFWVDADDRLDAENRHRLKTVFASLPDEKAAYLMTCACPTAESTKSNMPSLEQIRLFRNHPGVGWQYRIHEQVRPSIEALKYAIYPTDVVIFHVGYQNPAAMPKKRERNLRLLNMKLKELSYDPLTLYNIGQTYHSGGLLSQAQHYYRQCLKGVDPGQYYVCELYGVLTQVTKQLGETAEALQICRNGLALFPNDPYLLFEEAWLHYLTSDFSGAEVRLLRLLEIMPPPGDAGSVCRVSGHLARNNLAVLYRQQERFAEAETQWLAALREEADFPQAWVGLADLYLAQKRWPQMDAFVAKLAAEPDMAVHAGIFRAKKYLAMGETGAARRALEQIIVDVPQALAPRLLLSRLLLQHGQDKMATEAALRGVLALDPGNGEARQNLDQLLVS